MYFIGLFKKKSKQEGLCLDYAYIIFVFSDITCWWKALVISAECLRIKADFRHVIRN